MITGSITTTAAVHHYRCNGCRRKVNVLSTTVRYHAPIPRGWTEVQRAGMVGANEGAGEHYCADCSTVRRLEEDNRILEAAIGPEKP